MRTLDKDRWRIVSPLLDELFDLDADHCQARLAEIRRDDPELATLLAQMLDERARLESEAFLEGQAADVAQLPMPEVPSLAGTRLGAYTLERPLGQGGMGSVWLGRRSDGRFEGQAAIKFLNLALLARGGAERFRREGNLLARLAHPHIARLLDAGVTGGGQPYLVLEYVDGEPIDRWCRTHALSVRDRLRLFLDVLAAVSHAHSNLILHRDLKPTNILVTRAGQVKLLDFGIGKMLEDQQHRTAPTQLTEISGRAFTAEYASPEQVLGNEITTAADVYSLGVVLFELLTGQRPYKLKRTSAAAVEQAVAEQDVPTASTVAPAPLRRELRGDLDAILNQALRKDPTQRYATVAELTADIERHLHGLPVQAQPDRVGYRLAKFVRRNAFAVGGALAVSLAILVGSGLAVWQAHEATRQRDRALALAARNTAVLDFVRTMLIEAAPADEPIRVADLLDRSVAMLAAGGGQPDHEAAVLGVLATYFATGPSHTIKANELLDRSLELTKNTADHGLRGGLLCDSAYVVHRLGRVEQAMRLVEEGMKLAADDDMASVTCMNQRAGMSRASNDPEGTLKYALLAHARLLQSGVARPAEEAAVLDTIAAANMQAGRPGEAERYSSLALAKLAEAGRSHSPVAGAIRQNRAVYNHAAADYRRALENYDEAMKIAVKWSPGGEAPSYLLSNRGKALRDLGRHDEALAQFNEAVAVAQRNRETPMQVDALVHRAATFLEMGDIGRADASMAEAAAANAKLAPGSPTALAMISVRARIDAAHGRFDDALMLMNQFMEAMDRRKAVTSAVTAMLRARSDVHLKMGNLDAAQADATRALDVSRRIQGAAPHSTLTGLALLQMARVRIQRGAPTEARTMAADAAAHLAAMLGDDHPETVRARKLAA